MHSFTNRLIDETSPYLLQHAHNPVNWYPWGPEALELAKQENKPILVSIGYAACHWCHVMERESFENEATAAIMNQHFINIKIDREERPDLDHIYMDAVQAITGSGGWPLNVFLTPATKPFYGGTYFPPQRAFNRPSWQETLYGVLQAFRERRHEIDAQAENLTQHLQQSNLFGIRPNNKETIINNTRLEETVTALLKQADTLWGGFGKAPKFPQSFSIQFLLRHHQVSGNKQALQQALLSLDKMMEGGIYDQLGGGFARYSTDNEWLAPHFEKMLYDNALLVSVFSEAFQLTGKEMYREVIDQTIDFVQRELMQENKGFYAALDADSEGTEGKFYVWSAEEIKKLLGSDALTYCDYYDVTEKGNWEGTNILRVKKNLLDFAAEKKSKPEKIKQLLLHAGTILMAERTKRVRPLTDDKIILGWNALMNTACSKAFAATGNEAYRQLAIDNMNFLLNAFNADGAPGLYHTWKNNRAKYPAFLDDYACLIQALLHLQEVTTDVQWLKKAGDFANIVITQFADSDSPFFFYTTAEQSDVIVRKKEVYDGAVPSGNAVMAVNLYHLGILLNKGEWRKRSEEMVESLGNAIIKYPTSFSCWAGLLQEMIAGTNEIAIVGPEHTSLHRELMGKYIPHKVVMSSEKHSGKYPLLAEKEITQRTSIFNCRNYTCQLPVFSVDDLMLLINRRPEH